MVFALLYVLIGTLLSCYLWKKRVINRIIVLIIAGTSTLAGFVFLVPLMPVEFYGLITIISGQQTLTPAAIGIALILTITLLSGRIFCAHLCPLGTIQELVYAIPGKKIHFVNPQIFEVIRVLFVIIFLISALYAINVISFFGVYDFFAMKISAWFLVMVLILLVAVQIYRPICRAICPFGLIFSVLAHFGLYKLQQTQSCTNCRKCEKICPVDAAYNKISKRECYLCGKCVEVCPVDAIQFNIGRKETIRYPYK